MRNDSFCIKFFADEKKKLVNGALPIYVRLIINRKKVEISTRQTVLNSEQWNKDLQRVNGKSLVNLELNKIEALLRNIYDELRYHSKAITATGIKTKFLGRDEGSKDLYGYLESLIKERITTDTKLAASTIINYNTTLQHFNEFLNTQKLRYVSLGEADFELIRKFDNYLINKKLINSTVKTISRNTANKYHTKLKALFGIAVEDGIISKNPYSKFKIKNQESARTFLTKPELDDIEKHDLGNNKSLQACRDKFLFSVYTGLRFTDADNLLNENIEFDGKKYWINFRQQKTKEITRIPLLEKAKLIYDKYEFERMVSGYVLPRLSNQKVNAYLKTIADLVGITKPLTHHVARHTAATTIFLSNGVPLEVVSKQLGHSSIKTTQVYAKITNEILSKAADKLDEIFK